MSIQIPEDKGAKKRAGYWNVSVSLGVIALVFFFIGVNRANGAEMVACGWGACCFSLVFAISALSTKSDDRVIIIQQPAYIPVAPKLPNQPTDAVLRGAKIHLARLEEKARNLELARNWEGAAEAYEKAGMYTEAGKIRQEHLENNQPIVQIGQVGDTVLNDSVMISDGSSKSCKNCGNNVEVGWNICPNCSNPL